MDTQPCIDGRGAGGCGWVNIDKQLRGQDGCAGTKFGKEHKMRTEINERGRGMTKEARTGTDHRESACRKSSRKPNTKHGAAQLSTTDTCAISKSAQSQGYGQFQHTECNHMEARGQRHSRKVP